jgi:hypothetical protein
MAEEKTESRPPPRRRSPLTVLVVLALGILVLWLLAERNARQWWMVPEDGRVAVKKGILFVVGKTAFKSSDPELSRTYAPITPPEGSALPAERAFDDRAALDQELFELLARWAREDIQSEQLARMDRARGYLQRAARLAGLTATQRDQLKVLQGETAFQEASGYLQEAADALRKAADGMKAAAEGRGPVAAEAASLVRTLDPLVLGTNAAMLEAARFSAERYRTAAPPSQMSGPATLAPGPESPAPQVPPAPAGATGVGGARP